MNCKKRIICIILSFIMLLLFIIPSFAFVEYSEYCKQVPTDLGSQIDLNNATLNENMLYKFYIKFLISSDTTNSCYIQYNYIDNNGNEVTTNKSKFINYNSENDTLTINYINLNSDYTNVTYPTFSTQYVIGDYYYLPIYLYNVKSFRLFNSIVSNIGWVIYTSIPTDQQTLINEAYQIGYNNGYNNGYDNGFDTASNVVADLPLVDKLSTFIASFTGEDTARYITPLAICMILILIYCLFIRWILNLARSSKLTRLTDIVVLVSCIAILLIYYIPMIDFTINQNQTVENIYRVINDVNVGG